MSDYDYPYVYKARYNLAIREKMTPLSPQHGIVTKDLQFDVVNVKDTAFEPNGRVRDRWALRPDGYYCAIIYGGVVNAELVKSSAVPAPVPNPSQEIPPEPLLDENAIRRDEIDQVIRLLVVRRAGLK